MIAANKLAFPPCTYLNLPAEDVLDDTVARWIDASRREPTRRTAARTVKRRTRRWTRDSKRAWNFKALRARRTKRATHPLESTRQGFHVCRGAHLSKSRVLRDTRDVVLPRSVNWIGVKLNGSPLGGSSKRAKKQRLLDDRFARIGITETKILREFLSVSLCLYAGIHPYERDSMKNSWMA